MLNPVPVLVNQGRILVSPECPLTLHGLANAVWDEKREKLDKDVFARHFDHLMQLVYMCRVVDFGDNPIPPDYMVDGIRMMDLNYDKKLQLTESGRSLEEAFQTAQRRF